MKLRMEENKIESKAHMEILEKLPEVEEVSGIRCLSFSLWHGFIIFLSVCLSACRVDG